MLWGWCLFFRARNVCVCVCERAVVYIEAPDAHFASQLGKGSWPKPKQKATVVSPQIACSEYRSTTEANGEERWLCSEWAPGKTDGIYQAIERRESWLQVCEAPQKWSIDLGVFPKL